MNIGMSELSIPIIIIGITALYAFYLLLTLGDAVVHLCVNDGYHMLQVSVDDFVPNPQAVKDTAYLAALALMSYQNIILQGGQHFRCLIGALLDLSGCVSILLFLAKQAFQQIALLFLRLVLARLHQFLVFRQQTTNI